MRSLIVICICMLIIISVFMTKLFLRSAALRRKKEYVEHVNNRCGSKCLWCFDDSAR